MSKVILKCEKITKSFGQVRAVSGVSLEVKRGEFFALLGPSGSGKTTLLRIIAGLETPDQGSIEIGGRDVTRLPPYARGLGMVFQDFLLFPHKTVHENVIFPLKMQRLTKMQINKQLQWVLDLVHLDGYEERYPHQLSAGQKQRVALARGLVARPEVLLLDEPLANLDRELRKEMEIELRRFQVELDIPFVYVTHNQEEAITMSDQVAVMNKGVFEQVANKLDMYANPATRFVASFVGSSNRIVGRLKDVSRDMAILDWKGLDVVIPRRNGIKKGDVVEYFLKYEYVRINHQENNKETKKYLNQFCGTLRDVIFKGQAADFFVIMENGIELVASRRAVGYGKVKRGITIELAWESTDGHPFVVEDE